LHYQNLFYLNKPPESDQDLTAKQKEYEKLIKECNETEYILDYDNYD